MPSLLYVSLMPIAYVVNGMQCWAARGQAAMADTADMHRHTHAGQPNLNHVLCNLEAALI